MSSGTIVVNRRDEKEDVYIGRGSVWGNPFSHLSSSYPGVIMVASRAEAIRRYSEWIRTQPKLLAQLPKLRGKKLGCYCKPRACHGDVLVALVDALEE